MKGQGLAAFLLRQLVAQAGRQGYRAVCAEILADNAAMRALAAKLGFKTAPSPEDARLVAARLALQRKNARKAACCPTKACAAAAKQSKIRAFAYPADFCLSFKEKIIW